MAQPKRNMDPTSSRRFAPYRDALAQLSVRTRTTLPALVTSFAILHEVTAVVPIFGFFFASRALGVGERVVSALAEEDEEIDNGWMKQKMRGWVKEGEAWAGRVGRIYGLFGYTKGDENQAAPHINEGKLAGDIANAVVAYAATKALLPVRVGFSLWLSPMFARGVIMPVWGLFRRKPPL